MFHNEDLLFLQTKVVVVFEKFKRWLFCIVRDHNTKWKEVSIGIFLLNGLDVVNVYNRMSCRGEENIELSEKQVIATENKISTR